MHVVRNILALAFVAVIIGACGFRPLYAPTPQGLQVSGELSTVIVDEQKNRLGQMIRNEIVSEIRPAGSTDPQRYRLSLDISEQEIVSVDGFDTEADRLQLRIQARYILSEIGSGKQLQAGGTFSQTSYDIIDAPVANLQAKSNARERAAREIGLDIKTRLAAYFSSR